MLQSFLQRSAISFRQFSRKSWALFSCLHRQVRVGVLSVATLISATPRLMAAHSDLSLQRHTPDTLISATTISEASVSAARAPIATHLAPRPVTILTPRDLQAGGITTINDALKLIPTIDVRQRGAFGIQTDLCINGGTFDQLTILLGGTSLVNPHTGHLAADFPINLSDIQRIEILEGAASRIMGSQAFSGAIHVIPRTDTLSHPLEASLISGSYGFVKGEARTAWRITPHLFTSLSGSYQRSDGATPNSKFHGGKSYGQLTYTAPTFDLHLQSAFSANTYGANTFYSPAYPNQWESTRRHLLSIRGESKGRVHLSAEASWLRSTDHFQLIHGTPTGENYHRTDVFTTHLNAWTDWALGRTAVGAELREEIIYSTNLGRSLAADATIAIPHTDSLRYTHRDDRTNIAYFVEHQLRLSHLTLTPGCLLERNNAIDARFRIYPGLDISYRPTPALRLYASYNRALRLPTFTDLWYKSPTQEGNAGLHPETCDAYRLGLHFTHPLIQLQANTHYRHGTDQIDWVMFTPTDRYHATAFTLRTFGLDLNLSLPMHRLLGSRQPLDELQVAYAYLHQHRVEGAPYYKSNYALEPLRHNLVARLSHRFISAATATSTRLHQQAAQLTAQWTLRVANRAGGFITYQQAKPTDRLTPYGTHALLSLRLHWQQPHYALFADFDNLTNHRYFDLGNIPQPGFLFMGGVQLKL